MTNFIFDQETTTIWQSIRGFWEIWRGHISIFIAICMLRGRFAISQYPLKTFLYTNLIISISQLLFGLPFLDVFEVGDIEYRSGIPRVTGIFANPNTNAFFTYLLLMYWLNESAIKHSFGITAITKLTIASFMIFATGSRTIFFASIPLTFYYLILKQKKSLFGYLRSSYISIVALCFVSIILYFVIDDSGSAIGYQIIPTNIFDNIDLGPEHSNYRAFALTKVIERFTSAPIFGLGYGTYGTPSSFFYQSKFLISDNLIISEQLTQLDMLLPVVLVESGVCGLVFWLISLIFLLRGLYQIPEIYNSNRIAYIWTLGLIFATITGPGITHPLVYPFIPFLAITSYNRHGDQV